MYNTHSIFLIYRHLLLVHMHLMKEGFLLSANIDAGILHIKIVKGEL